jgi:hypothetical protein
MEQPLIDATILVSLVRSIVVGIVDDPNSKRRLEVSVTQLLANPSLPSETE